MSLIKTASVLIAKQIRPPVSDGENVSVEESSHQAMIIVAVIVARRLGLIKGEWIVR